MGRRPRTKKKRGKPPRWTIANADKYALYEESVYDPEADLEFIDRLFREEGRTKPMTLREDFAGTCKLAALWVASDPGRRAWCLDLDPEPLAYGREHHLLALGDDARRVVQLQEDVLHAETPVVDVATAFNFSYWVFKERSTMLRYFQTIHAHLSETGAFILDVQGGPDTQSETCEEREQDDFYYVWKTEAMDAISGFIRCSISFEFLDGSRFSNAFEYDWRLWHLPELRDILEDAGFSQVDVYWEGTDENGEGDGVFLKRSSAENEEAWIAYLVAWK